MSMAVSMLFTVTTLDDTGAGSLRWAINEANSRSGFDRIKIDASLSGGTITLGRDLATIHDRVSITGLHDPAGRAAIAIDFNGNQGLTFRGKRAAGSRLQGFALGRAAGDGLTLDASRITIQDNLIGVDLDGMTAMGNQGHGIRITKRSHGNLIGNLDPLTGVPLAQQVSNVISANAGSGIVVSGSERNRIANNRIGTSADGTSDLGNNSHGIALTEKARHNHIGGTAHTGNDPTKNEFQRPGQGNLISGNHGNGVLITKGASRNRLMGNFIGTDASGIKALSNDQNGVAIIKANNNALTGTTRNQSPFIYYNVVSGNGRNGLLVEDSKNTTIHANFFGLGADNQTIVGNRGDGALISGTSSKVQYGGVIPLGNVNAGNRGNGINVTDQVTKFISFNTFAGLTAFGGIAPNQESGIRISSNGRKNQVRTNVMSGNAKHGLLITGQARGIWVDPNIIGLNTYGTEATYSDENGKTTSWGNGGDGIRVSGRSEDIRIAGNRRSIIPQNTISNNNGHGIHLTGLAKNITIDQSFVGLSSTGRASFGNKLNGIFVAEGVSGLQIGARTNPRNGNQIVANLRNGIELTNPSQAKLFNNTLAGNAGNGVLLNGGRFNTLAGNNSSSNRLYGFNINTAKNSSTARNRGRNNGLGLYG
jgi:parallel beta-helix repeat protein